MKNNQHSRRRFIQSSAFGIIGVTAFSHLPIKASGKSEINDNELFYRYPSLGDSMVSSVVGASHSDINKVKELVTKRPELATASWDWGFGDAETALGAASHMGRRDIAEFLIEHGARPDIFTFAMFGAYKALENAIESMPGIQSIPGPHGITLLQHAKNRLRNTDITETDKANVEKVVSYLEKLGNADIKPKSLEISEEEKQKYLGEFRFGKKDNEIFIVDLNMRKLLQISRKGSFGRVMNKVDDAVFSPGGAPSVSISFTFNENKAVSLTIHEPDPLITALKI